MNIKNWQLQEAKNKLSYVVKEARQGKPQYITVHGKQAVVLISIDDYKKLTNAKSKLSEALLLPEIDDNEDLFTRNKEIGRDINL